MTAVAASVYRTKGPAERIKENLSHTIELEDCDQGVYAESLITAIFRN
jgi:hypothetical protein